MKRLTTHPLRREILKQHSRGKSYKEIEAYTTVQRYEVQRLIKVHLRENLVVVLPKYEEGDMKIHKSTRVDGGALYQVMILRDGVWRYHGYVDGGYFVQSGEKKPLPAPAMVSRTKKIGKAAKSPKLANRVAKNRSSVMSASIYSTAHKNSKGIYIRPESDGMHYVWDEEKRGYCLRKKL